MRDVNQVVLDLGPLQHFDIGGFAAILKWAAGNFETPRGTVLSSWRRGDDSLRVEVVVPFGSQATVVLPMLQLRDVSLREGERTLWKEGKAAETAEGVASIKEDGDHLTVETGSGRYVFVLRGN